MNMAGEGLGLDFRRINALDAKTAEPLDGWFAAGGPLGEIPQGDKACLLSHRMAWEEFIASGDSHAAIMEDDVVLSPSAGRFLKDSRWIPAGIDVVKLEHYGPPGQSVLLSDFRDMGGGFRLARMRSRHTGAAAYILTRHAAEILLREPQFNLPVDHLLFNPNNSSIFKRVAPWQLLPAIARQKEFVGEKSDIEGTRLGLRALSFAYARRELIRFGYDLKLLPRQLALAASGQARFTRVGTES
jgi:glycosyl transferase family 25